MKRSNLVGYSLYFFIFLIFLIVGLIKPNEASPHMIFWGIFGMSAYLSGIILEIRSKKGVKTKGEKNQLTKVRCPECGYRWNSYYSKSKINFTICPKCKEPIYKQLAKARKYVHHYSWNLDSRSH